MAKRKRVRVHVRLDRQLQAQGFDLGERVKAFETSKGKTRDVAALTAAAWKARHDRRSTKHV